MGAVKLYIAGLQETEGSRLRSCAGIGLDKLFDDTFLVIASIDFPYPPQGRDEVVSYNGSGL